ncbi:MAG: phosphoribosyltransferase domain-containing protein, partial [Acetatifactor sp.]|nr:phosphoribosyltransferase domain-containing protein [Acetatifactor sp.]
MYTESDLVKIAKRENNKKRNYLVVNPLQGKHIPVSPGMELQVFSEHAALMKT